jgi:hypothetical protein
MGGPSSDYLARNHDGMIILPEGARTTHREDYERRARPPHAPCGYPYSDRRSTASTLHGNSAVPELGTAIQKGEARLRGRLWNVLE